MIVIGRWFQKLSILAFIFLCASTAAVAETVPIAIFNTGVAANGSLLAGGANDAHWSITVSPDVNFPPGPASVAFGNKADPFPANWVAENSTSASQWIAPRGIVAMGNATGDYTYQTTFNLTGLNPATAFLTGMWAAADSGIEIILNGAVVDSTHSGASTFTAFSITSGFTSGVNTLDFIVDNSGNGGAASPTGLDVAISGEAATQVNSTPEPNSFLFLGTGLAAGLMIRKRLQVAAAAQNHLFSSQIK